MITPTERRVIAGATIFLSILIVIVSLVGILTPDFYSLETKNWQVQSIGQDFIDLLLIAPTLLITGVSLFASGKRRWLFLQGILLYVIYTFTIYCFDIHFNKLFPIYCVILGIAFFLFIYFIYTMNNLKNTLVENSWIRKASGIYFIAIATLFYFLWLSDIIPPIVNNTIPASLASAGLVTNPVHVIDLAVFLPGLFITGILLLKNRLPGIVMAPVMLSFFIPMNLTILSLNIMMVQHQLEESTAVAGIMAVLTLLSVSMLLIYFRNMQYETA